MAALILRQIESGSVTMVTTDVSEPITLATTLLDTGKTMLLFSVRTTSGSTVDYQVIGRVSSTTEIIFERASGPGTDVVIEYQVVEFSSGILVQHKYLTMDTSPKNVTINEIDLAKTFPILTLVQTGSAFGANDQVSAEITSTTNLQLVMGSISATPVSIQVVQIDNATVQKMTGSYGTGATCDLSISAITESLTFWVFSLNTGSGGTFQNLPYLAYVDTDTLRFTRVITSSGINYSYFAYVVSLSSGVSVQNVSTVIASSGTTVSPSIPNSITVANTALLLNGIHQRAAASNDAGDDAGSCYLTLSGLTTTQFTATRGDAPAFTATTNVQVLSFNKSAPSFMLIQDEE